MLSNLGGSLSLLEQALDEHSTLPATGPRDDARKAMIASLLTYDSFPHFCEMMRSKSAKIDSATTTYYDVNDLEKLTSMGFDKAFAVAALNNCDGDFDEALQYLFDNPPPSPRENAFSTPTLASAPPEDFRDTRPKYNRNTKEQVDSSVTVALSKQDSMRRRNSSIASEASAVPSDSTSNTLAEATSAEKTLDYMFKRREQLSSEITDQRKVVVNFTKNPNRVSDDHLEELYLFLKEMVHNGEDLATHKQRIHTYVFSRITPDQGTIVPNLLSLMLLENEDYLLQKNINRLLNGESLESVLADQGNSSSSTSPSPSGPDTSELDELHRQHALEIQRANEALEAEAERQRRKLREQLKNKRKHRLKQCKDSNMLDEEIGRVERQLDEENAQVLSNLDDKLASRNQQTLAGLQTKQIRIIEETTRLNRKLTADELEAINDDIAMQLRDQHAIDIAKMREALDLEKSRQRAALQARLRNKRKKFLSTSPAPSDEDAAEKILNIDLEETNGLNDIDSKFSRQMYNMVRGPTESFAAISTGLRMACENLDSEDWMDSLAKLHKLHCTNLATMQSSLMDEKSKQQSNLQARLQAMRQKKLAAAIKRGATPEELEEIEAECEAFEAKSLEKLEEKFKAHIAKIESSFMEQHNVEIAKISDTDSGALEKLVAESTFDYESAAAALKAAHERDVSKHGDALEEEKRRQEEALKEKLARRRKKKMARMMDKGMTQSEVDKVLGEEEVQEMKFLKDEWKLDEYIDGGVERGVWRVLKTAGGTRTLTSEEDKEEEKTFSKGFTAADWGWGEEDGEGDEEKRKSIMEKHTDATKALVGKLKDERKKSHNKLRERLEEKKRKKMKELKQDGASDERIEEVERELEEEAIKERIQNDRMLTLSEHKAIEEFEFGTNNAAEGGNLNTYELLDEIHSEYKEERDQLQNALMEEKKRQKAELRRKKKERKKEKRRASVVAALEEELMEEDNNEKKLEMEVAKIHKANQESKATLDMMMQMEQARQKEALQKRLMRKRAEKRRNSMVSTGKGPVLLAPL
eukprot:CAMPEP_0118651880 /NCGR_PEP_ID=MMETSP0785-20121206/11020_1 /TAXON_ID=91992 /ORGANISM="Bolidomonas pacifica, Strain CCMP 1866" /LENGTH=1039 /DNA_ID=CAMNT_0006544359 /DNA_START=222 /DNA_END=3338 /DNA_ORIENTATION=+